MFTKDQQQQRDLFESERSFRLLVEAVADYALYMLDPNGYIATGRVLEISYEGGHDVRFEAHGRKTVIDAPDDLVQNETKHELLRGSGAITKVMVDTTKLYERQGSKESLQMFVLDLLL